MTKRFDCTIDEKATSEDGGKALVLYATPFEGKDLETGDAIPIDNEKGLHFNIISWDDDKNHEQFKSLGIDPGDKVTITLQVWKQE